MIENSNTRSEALSLKSSTQYVSNSMQPIALLLFALRFSQWHPSSAKTLARKCVVKATGQARGRSDRTEALVNAHGTDSYSAVPMDIWLLQQNGQDVSHEKHLAERCYASISEEACRKSMDELIGHAVAFEFLDPTMDFGPRSLLLPGELTAKVNEISFQNGGVGHALWEVGIALGIWLALNADLLYGKRILELGAGVGFVGIVAALSGATSVTVSDVFSDLSSTRHSGGSASECITLGLLGNLEANLCLNRIEAKAQIMALDWNECLVLDYKPVAQYPVVVGSDLLYEGVIVGTLVAALL